MALVIIELLELQLIIEAAVDKAFAKSNPKCAEVSQSTKLLNIDEVADLLQVSVSSVNIYKKQGLIPFYRIGRRVFFKEAEVLESLTKINK